MNRAVPNNEGRLWKKITRKSRKSRLVSDGGGGRRGHDENIEKLTGSRTKYKRQKNVIDVTYIALTWAHLIQNCYNFLCSLLQGVRTLKLMPKPVGNLPQTPNTLRKDMI